MSHPKELKEPYPPGSEADLLEEVSGVISSVDIPTSLQPTLGNAKTAGQLKAAVLKIHLESFNMAKSLGLDACAELKASRMENILATLTTADLVCKYCKKKYSSVNHLKNHIKQKHLKKTAHFCAQCKKYFTEASTLLRHMQKHQGNPTFICTVCQKGFFSQSKLDDHKVTHQGGKMYFCQHCQVKSYKRQKACKAHEIQCTANPDRPAKPRCRICNKEYATRSSMQRHFTTAHPGEDPDV